MDRPPKALSQATPVPLPETQEQRLAGSVTFMGDQDGKVRDVGTGKAEKGARRSSWQKGEFAPAPERAPTTSKVVRPVRPIHQGANHE